ncbi:MAG: RluA family pseudouridine synthase [Rhodospirillaceae bacterium]|nr:MAG: RluA family pseudouridine synthase [Rhodospirillaceae bacterium]
MSGVTQVTVAADEGELRLDRWFKRHFPQLGHGRLEKLLRTGQVRVDGARVKAGHRMAAGQVVRIPPLSDSAPDKTVKKAPPRPVSERDAAALLATVLYKDDDLIALNKPAGLAVQGGTKTDRHLDGMLDALRFGGDRPRLVHRLDRDTSGVILVARTAAAAARLGRMFQSRDMEKIYWALVVGQPRHPAGTISAALAKTGAPGHQRMTWDEEEGKKAVTDYRTVAAAGGKVTWLELSPRTGRTHQLRAHCALLNTPILGDHKYAGHSRTTPDSGLLAEIGDHLCLHARELMIPRHNGKPITVVAPLPDHMARAFAELGFSEDEAKV